MQAQAFDPESLEAAINAIPHESVTAIAQDWYWNSPAIASRIAEELHGATPESIGDPNRLGWRAARAITDALYTHLHIGAEGPEAVIETRTRAGSRRRLQIPAGRIDQEFEARGFNEHLDTAGPGAEAVRTQLARMCAENGPPRTVFREHDHEITAWCGAGGEQTPHRPNPEASREFKGPDRHYASGYSRSQRPYGGQHHDSHDQDMLKR